jgi:GrpB-like predicted nucleotidyltransferase (UPF0157 family)
MRVPVVPYDDRWPGQFARLRGELAAALEGVAVVAIEHVGSTSVPGLAAKPVIDVDVVVESADVPAAIAALEATGYAHLGECGILDRHAFRAPSDEPRRNVYVTVAGCLSLRNHLGVRDVLRADPELRAEYGALKLRLATRDYESIDDYVADKSAVLQRVLHRAGLDPAELGIIDDVNRASGQPR